MKAVLRALTGFFVIVSTLVVIAMVGSFWWASQQFMKAGRLDTPVPITVPSGANIGSIAEQLSYVGVIDDYAVSGTIFKVGGRITGQATKLKAGEYEIPAHASMKDILDLLESGKVIQRNVTLREGLTSFQIVELLSDVKELEQVRIETPLEGALLPETYSYSKGESNADVVRRMEIAMRSAIDELWENRAQDLPVETKEEAIILASIIEKETGVPSERKKVAGVFINRLRKGMLLQTDPTVIYALTEGKPKNDGRGPLGRRLLKKDLKFDSPYNTYLYAGLPPGPIANPGYASIEAALNPEEHNYIYFVADGSGGHAFSKSLREHNNNVIKWRKVKKSK